MAKRTAAGLGLVLLVFPIAGILGFAADTPAAGSNVCAPNGSACVYASNVPYANGTSGMCIAGTCAYCKASACSTACRGLPGREQNTCSDGVIRANVAASERERRAAMEKAEGTRLLD